MPLFDGKSISYSHGDKHGFWFREPEEAALMIYMLRRSVRAMRRRPRKRGRIGAFPWRGLRALGLAVQRDAQPWGRLPATQKETIEGGVIE